MLYGKSDNTQPHALMLFTPTSGTNFPAHEIQYTDFKKVSSIKEGSNILTISYGVDQQRTKSAWSKFGSSNHLIRYYLGDYEEEFRTGAAARKIHYINGGDGMAAIYVQNNGRDTLYYAYSDFQGNLTALTNASGSVLERYAYDPWGNRRNPTDWTQDDTRTSFIIHRGYTLHEHLDEFKLINMNFAIEREQWENSFSLLPSVSKMDCVNGRVYDPRMGMFLSPDPYIQAPGDWLNYNRYSYCLYNPLMYVDPSGEFVHLVIGTFSGGIMNWAFNGSEWNAKGLGFFGIGVLTGGVISRATSFNSSTYSSSMKSMHFWSIQ